MRQAFSRKLLKQRNHLNKLSEPLKNFGTDTVRHCHEWLTAALHPPSYWNTSKTNSKSSLSLLHISSHWRNNWKWQSRNRRFWKCCILKSHFGLSCAYSSESMKVIKYHITKAGKWLVCCFGLLSRLLELLIVISIYSKNVTGHKLNHHCQAKSDQ